MSKPMQTLSFDKLLDWILTEFRTRRSIFGVPEELFYGPKPTDRTVSMLFGERLQTPIGPAAGPHTQLAQNILCAWLCGGRFIELKTVQVMDELDIPRPCIDMADEGYNVEWSQELRLAESADEYVKAWVLVRVLRRLLGYEDVPFGTVFNMSVGYNLEGILSPPMQRFMDRMGNAEDEVAAIVETLRRCHPEFADLEIPTRIVSSVTLSTMHGCPPDEVERIARYLIEERGLHTTVKLNPTLLGKDAVLGILHDRLGYREIDIPDRVFEHDLQYDRAVELIASLRASAASRGLVFSVKLSNTLAMANHRRMLPGDEMYMSGRALYPVTMQLFQKLRQAFDGDLNVSYSAGADAWNVASLLACGARPITVASDLLKPGGYGRLAQYLEEIERALDDAGADDLDALAASSASRLARSAEEALVDRRYAKTYAAPDLPKVRSGLEPFDCIAAPCVEACAVCQDIPEYCGLIARGETDSALSVILDRNPLPGITGHVCTHLCQTRCTRTNTDEAVSIRLLKRHATERGSAGVVAARPTGRRAAVIGGGPSGLAAAYFLAQSGVDTTIFEAKDRIGGMPAIAPAFRLPKEVVKQDVRRIVDLGVTVETNRPIAGPPDALLDRGFDAVYVACGFTRDDVLDLPGAGADGVYGALDLLDRVAHGDPPPLGDRVVIIGGGNTAMDVARTAQRLTGAPATVVYRRTRSEMPAERDEIDDLLLEGNVLCELASPIRIETDGGRVSGLVCQRNRLGEPDETGRRRPVPVEGSEFRLPASAVLFAVGQRADTAFVGTTVARRPDGSIVVDPHSGRVAEGIYAGGDVARGPEIIIAACADGRRAAEAICAHLGVLFSSRRTDVPTEPVDVGSLKVARARREPRQRPQTLSLGDRAGFDLVERPLDLTAARREAARCLQCRTLCDKCVDVCPNRANVAYTMQPLDVTVPRFVVRGDSLVAVGTDRVTLSQSRQIVHLDDLCNECGNCATFCIHDGRPYHDKPRLVFARSRLDAAPDLVYALCGATLHARTPDGVARVTVTEDSIEYETSAVRIRMDSAYAVQEARLVSTTSGEISLRPAVEMTVLWRGITTSAPWLVAALDDRGGST